jgi:hypothetical protein
MELYFEEIANTMEGYDEFEHEAWSFKHDRLNVEKRVQEGGSDKLGRGVKTSDVARLMELFQSSLLKYWKFQPAPREKRISQVVADLRTGRNPRRQSSDSTAVAGDDQVRRRWRVGSIFGKGKRRQRDVDMELTGTPQMENRVEDGERQDPREGFKQGKKMPVRSLFLDWGRFSLVLTLFRFLQVIFFDEAHRLYVCFLLHKSLLHIFYKACSNSISGNDEMSPRFYGCFDETGSFMSRHPRNQ